MEGYNKAKLPPWLTLLQVRVEGSSDPDYLEMELPRDALTLEVTNYHPHLTPSFPPLTSSPPTHLSSHPPVPDGGGV